jgi:ParB family chromosome partitioning protein
VARDGEEIAEGQGEDAGEPDDIDLPAFLTADLPDSAASMMAAE